MKKILLAIIGCCIGLCSAVTAQTLPNRPQTNAPTVFYGELLGISPPLSSMTVEPVSNPFRRFTTDEIRRQEGVRRRKKPVRKAPPQYDELFREQSNGLQVRADSTVIQNFLSWAGIDESLAQVGPPDPTLIAGSGDNVIQMVNADPFTRYKVFSKTGTQQRSATTQSLWSAFNALPIGDPIVMFDREAQRYIMTEVDEDSLMLFAVSQTANPLGAWSAFKFAALDFPDYPKIAITRNAYVVTTNETNDMPAYIIDRNAVLTNAARPKVFRIPVPRYDHGGFETVTPVDRTGATTPLTGNIRLVRLYDDAFLGIGSDSIQLIEIAEPNFAQNTPPAVRYNNFNVPNFDSYVTDNGLDGLLQFGDPLRNELDALEFTVMNRPQYRRFTTHESMVFCHIVDATGTDVAGIRWYELRKLTNATAWSMYQMGTFEPDTLLHRFMPAISINSAESIAIGYATLGNRNATKAGLKIAARTKNDPLGRLTVEKNVIDGSSYYPDFRWGDYSDMSIDPANDQTFWFTGEHALSGGFYGTRIVKFDVNSVRTSTRDLDALDNVSLHLLKNPLPTGSDLPYEIRGGSTGEKGVLRLINAVGQVLHTRDIALSSVILGGNVPTENLSAGIYFLQLSVSGSQKMVKFVVQ
jgi:hypothetical protein